MPLHRHDDYNGLAGETALMERDGQFQFADDAGSGENSEKLSIGNEVSWYSELE
jgi:hypothetical protein